MPTYAKLPLAGRGSSLPSAALEPLTGLQTFARHPAVEVMRAQNGIAPLSRRIVGSVGLRGDSSWRIPSTDPESATQIYPDRYTYYEVARTRVELTPGCFLAVVGAAVPSGICERASTPGEIAAGALAFQEDGIGGWIRVTVDWTPRTGSTAQTVREIQLPGSTLEFGAEDATAGGLWRTLKNFEIPDILPPGVLLTTSELVRWCDHVTATVTIEVRGSPRVVDLAVHEVPIAYAADVSDTADSPYSLYPEAGGLELYPMAQTSSANDTRGSRQVAATALAQAERLGPMLLSWGEYTENDARATSTIVARTTANDGTTWESVTNSAQTGTGAAAYLSTMPGWSVSCGGYARRYANNNVFALRDRIAVVPVCVRVYGRTQTAGVGTVRVQTALHSYVDVVLPVAGSNAWSRAMGWLECGISPEQPVVAQVFINHLGASGRLDVEAVEVYVMDPAAPGAV